MNPAADALNIIRLAFCGDGGAITAISDFADDPTPFAPGTLRDALDTIAELGADRDITTITESLMTLDEAFGREFALRNELCPTCFSDIDICDC